MKKYKKAEHWYKEAIKKKNLKALQGFAIMNYEYFKDNIKAVKYMIALANKKYPKEKILRFFKIKWKLDEETIKKGYEEQIKAKDIPKSLKYTKGL